MNAKTVKKLKPEEVVKLRILIIQKLDELDTEDFFGTEGWRHYLGVDE